MVACAIVVVIAYVKKFVALPSEEQLAKVKQWLLYAVVEAEKKYQGGTLFSAT